MTPDVPPSLHQGETVPRLVRARRNLLFALQGHGKDGIALFATLALSALDPPTKQTTSVTSSKRKSA